MFPCFVMFLMVYIDICALEGSASSSSLLGLTFIRKDSSSGGGMGAGRLGCHIVSRQTE